MNSPESSVDNIPPELSAEGTEAERRQLSVIEVRLAEAASDLLTGRKRTKLEREAYGQASGEYKAELRETASIELDELLESGVSMPQALGQIRDNLLASKARVLSNESLATLEDSAIARTQERIARRGKVVRGIARAAAMGVGLGGAMVAAKHVDAMQFESWKTTAFGSALGMALQSKAKSLLSKMPTMAGGLMDGGLERYEIKDKEGFYKAIETAKTPEERASIKLDFMHRPELQVTCDRMNQLIGEAVTANPEGFNKDETLNNLITCLDDNLDRYYGVDSKSVEATRAARIKHVGDVIVGFATGLSGKKTAPIMKMALEEANNFMSGELSKRAA